MSTAADLDAALQFVTDRISKEAAAAGQPLTADQKLLLANLPAATSHIWIPMEEDPSPPLVPANDDLETLCTLTKSAYSNDRRTHPGSRDWEFSFAVFRLNNHPMWGLLQQAGLKYRSPLVDSALLILAGFLALAVMLSLADVMDTFGGKNSEQFVGIVRAAGVTALLAASYFAARRVERSHLQKEIDRCRQSCRQIDAPPTK